MRVLVIGASGLIGHEVVEAFRHKQVEVVEASRNRSAQKVDISSADSLRALFKSVGKVDAIVSAAGDGRFKALTELSDDDFAFTLGSKLMGQVNIVRLGIEALVDGGSFTLTTGVLAQDPIPGSGAISLVNAGLEGFVRAAALELPRGLRVNCVSPGWVSETLAAMGRDPKAGIPAARVAEAYLLSVEGSGSGKVISAVAR